jgi:hypothetical protein
MEPLICTAKVPGRTVLTLPMQRLALVKDGRLDASNGIDSGTNPNELFPH